VDELRARLEIEDLLYRYAEAIDSCQWGLLESCFTPDAVGLYGDFLGRLEGAPAIVAACRGVIEPLDGSQHFVTNPRITIVGDEARSRSYFHAQHIRREAEGGPHYVVAGSYVDQCVRSGETWRIRMRKLEGSWAEGNPRVMSESLG